MSGEYFYTPRVNNNILRFDDLLSSRVTSKTKKYQNQLVTSNALASATQKCGGYTNRQKKQKRLAKLKLFIGRHVALASVFKFTR